MIENFTNMDELNAAVAAEPDRFKDGYTVHMDEGDRTLVYNKGEWVDYNATTTTGGLNVKLYDLNRQIISQLPDFNEPAWEAAKKIVEDYMAAHANQYYMLYGREYNYFTLFRKQDEHEFATMFDAVKTCFDHIGPVKSFDAVQGNEALEIWANITTQETQESITTCFYFFPYDDGVVTFSE